jgi:UDP-N-acetyl-2-amino-2-deoxyglucuronate dehydrogenase
MTQLSVGIIGLGRIGHAFGVSPADDPLSHSAAFSRLPDVHIGWGLDPDAMRRRAFAEQFPNAETCDDGDALPPQQSDIVVVSSPTAAHRGGIDVALRLRPRVIVCEKPIASTVREARQIVERVRDAGSLLIVNYTRRFTPMLEHLRSETAAGRALAGPVTGCIRYTGGLVHNGTHWIDLCRAIFGDIVTARQIVGGGSENESGAVELMFRHDRTVVLVPVSTATYSIGEGEFYGASAAVRFAEGGDVLSVSDAEPSGTWAGFRALGPSRVLTREGLRGHMMELARHAAVLARDGGTPQCTGDDAIAALETVETATTVHA